MRTERANAQLARLNRSMSEWRRPYAESLQLFMGPALNDCLARNGRGPVLLSSDIESSNFEIVVKRCRPIPHEIPELSVKTHRKGNQIIEPIEGFADSGRSGVAVVSVADFFAAIPLHHQLWCAVEIDNRRSGYRGPANGVELVAWGGADPSPPPKLSAGEALKGLSARTLNAEDTAVLTADMRLIKHADPMYGIVSAYLYNAIGDVSNIRRMCYYYQGHGQDAPFDIAMLAQLELKARPDGGFYVEVPEVAETPVAERYKDMPSFVWEKTPAVTVNVAGVTPLLRAGWQHIQASRHEVHRKCSELTAHVTESPISTFQGADTGARLIEILKEL